MRGHLEECGLSWECKAISGSMGICRSKCVEVEWEEGCREDGVDMDKTGKGWTAAQGVETESVCDGDRKKAGQLNRQGCKHICISER